ncbi:MAG: hypothetical protein KDM63_22340, partial [Verrucomicrobiae bacterium]|nr:hypothetical protein [Verrucomicrobiae bacterium]
FSVDAWRDPRYLTAARRRRRHGVSGPACVLTSIDYAKSSTQTGIPSFQNTPRSFRPSEEIQEH